MRATESGTAAASTCFATSRGWSKCATRPSRNPTASSTRSLKKGAAARSKALSLAGRDIGDIPAGVNPERKVRAEQDFRFFREAYFPAAFTLLWSDDHLKVIAKIEPAVLTGGLFAHAIPRGSGQTTLTTVACVWAILNGHRQFVCLVAASAERARSLLANIKTWFEPNELLTGDYPQIGYPIRKLGRITNRQLGQTCRGEATRLEWTADKIVLPTIPGSKASGAVITTSSMTGSEIRGQNHALADGTVIRLQLAVIDDPQTTESGPVNRHETWTSSRSTRKACWHGCSPSGPPDAPDWPRRA